MTYEPGEGPVDNIHAAKERAKADRAKHHVKDDDAAIEAVDLEDPALQEED